MTAWDFSELLAADSAVGLRWQMEQVGKEFPGFLAGTEGRFYALFGGKYAGKTSVLEALHCAFPPRPGEVVPEPRSVLVDLEAAGTPASSRDLFRHLFAKMREQLGVCSIDQQATFLFEEERKALLDFSQAFGLITSVLQPESSRIVLLVDNADALMEHPFAPVLVNDLYELYHGPIYVNSVSRQLDVVMAGAGALYDRLLDSRFAREGSRHWYNLGALPPDTTKMVIELRLPQASGRPDLVERILHYTGGQPFLLDHFATQLQRPEDGQPLSPEAVDTVARECLESLGPPSDWFYECSRAIEVQGARPVFHALLGNEAMTWPQIKATIRERQLGDLSTLLAPAQAYRALDALLFHGLIRYKGEVRGSQAQYCVTSTLFKRWFVENVLSEEERAGLERVQEGDVAAARYDVATIRELLANAFTDESLRSFCEDRALFRPMLREFGAGFSFQRLINAVVTHCQTHALFGELLTEIRKVNPRQYQRYYPDS